MDEYKFNEASHTVYQFIWHEFCDWYLELIKPYLYQDEDVSRRDPYAEDPFEGSR